MTFENKSNRRLSFAPALIIVKNEQTDFRLVIHETDFSHTEQIHATSKMIYVISEAQPDRYEELPTLELVDGNFSLAESVALQAPKLTKIDGDLHVNAGAKFYAPLLAEVTGFIYLGNGALVNAPKIEHLLANDDESKIKSKSDLDWLSTI